MQEFNLLAELLSCSWNTLSFVPVAEFRYLHKSVHALLIMNQRVVHARAHTQQVNVKSVIKMLHVSLRSTSEEGTRSSEKLVSRERHLKSTGVAWRHEGTLETFHLSNHLCSRMLTCGDTLAPQAAAPRRRRRRRATRPGKRRCEAADWPAVPGNRGAVTVPWACPGVSALRLVSSVLLLQPGMPWKPPCWHGREREREMTSGARARRRAAAHRASGKTWAGLKMCARPVWNIQREIL